MDKVIKLQDSTGVNTLLPWADFMGIDTSNVIASVTASAPTYTATEDCMAIAMGTYRTLNIGDVNIYTFNNASDRCDYYLLKKGTTMEVSGAGGTKTITAFGIKRTTN